MTGHADIAAFAALIRARRKALGLSQEAVAAQAFGNPDRKTFISAIENKRQPRITVDTATKIAGTLDIHIDELPATMRPSIAVQKQNGDAPDLARLFNAQLDHDMSKSVLLSYQVVLARGLHVLDRWTGPAFGPRSLAVCLALSIFYVVVTGIIGYGADGGRIGSAVPFAQPQWATNVPHALLALASGAILLGSGWLAFWLVIPRSDHAHPMAIIARIGGGAAVCGSGCAIARVFGAEPIAVALVAALFAFGALSVWPVKVAALAGLAGALIAAFGNGVVDERGLPFGTLAFLLCGGLLGAGAGAAASAAAREIADRRAGVLAGAGTGVTVAAAGAGVAIALRQEMSATDQSAQNLIVLMWIVLPTVNALTDYVSLGISHSLGRWMARSGSAWRHIGVVLALDVLAAMILMIATVLLIEWGLIYGGLFYEVAFSGTAYIDAAIAAPWTDGLWLSLMVLTTLFWTYLHIALVMGPVIAAKLIAWAIEDPLRARIAARTQARRIDTVSAAWLTLRYVVFWAAVIAIAIVPVWIVLTNMGAILGSFA